MKTDLMRSPEDLYWDIRNEQCRFFERFLHYVECQIATEQGALGRKSTSKWDLRRLASITDAMIADAERYATDESKQNGSWLRVRERWGRTADRRRERNGQ